MSPAPIKILLVETRHRNEMALMSIRKRTILPSKTIRHIMNILGANPTKEQAILVTKLTEAFLLHLMVQSKGLSREKIFRCIRKNKFFFLYGIEDGFKGILQQETDKLNNAYNMTDQAIDLAKNEHSHKEGQNNMDEQNNLEKRDGRGYISDSKEQNIGSISLESQNTELIFSEKQQHNIFSDKTSISQANDTNEALPENIFSDYKDKLTQITDETEVYFILDSDTDD